MYPSNRYMYTIARLGSPIGHHARNKNNAGSCSLGDHPVHDMYDHVLARDDDDAPPEEDGGHPRPVQGDRCAVAHDA